MGSISRFIKLLMQEAIYNAYIDELQQKYFTRELCPIGTAGLNCELYCNPLHGLANLFGECICNSPKWKGLDCSIEVPEDTQLIPKPLKVTAYAMVGMNLSIVLVCAVWLFWNRNAPQIQIIQPLFLGLVLLGCTISTSAIFAMAQEDNDGHGQDVVVVVAPQKACMAIPWLYSVGFSVTFGTLFTKIYRIWTLFRNAAEFKRISFNAMHSFIVIGSVLAIDVCVLLVWTLIDPLHWERTIISSDQFGNPLQSAGFCTCDHWMIFVSIIASLHMVLLLIASYLCYAARAVPTSFSEGKYVKIAMVSHLQILLVGLPVLIIVGSDPATSFFVRSCIIWMNDLVVVLLIFGNLILSVHRKQQERGHSSTNGNVQTTVNMLVKDAIQEYSFRISKDSDAGSVVSAASDSEVDPNNYHVPTQQDIDIQAMYESERLKIAKELSTPPASDRETVKVIWGRTKYWCGHCSNLFGSPGLWTDHDTVDHEELLAKKKMSERSGKGMGTNTGSSTVLVP